jgi:hypothetical protein
MWTRGGGSGGGTRGWCGVVLAVSGGSAPVLPPAPVVAASEVLIGRVCLGGSGTSGSDAPDEYGAGCGLRPFIFLLRTRRYGPTLFVEYERMF